MRKRKQNYNQARYYLRADLDVACWEILDNSSRERLLDSLQNSLWNVVKMKLWYHLRAP